MEQADEAVAGEQTPRHFGVGTAERFVPVGSRA